MRNKPHLTPIDIAKKAKESLQLTSTITNKHNTKETREVRESTSSQSNSEDSRFHDIDYIISSLQELMYNNSNPIMVSQFPNKPVPASMRELGVVGKHPLRLIKSPWSRAIPKTLKHSKHVWINEKFKSLTPAGELVLWN